MDISRADSGTHQDVEQSIVEEHRLLAERIDEAGRRVDHFFSTPARQTASEIGEITSLLAKLIETAQAHFQHEEALMVKNEFPGFASHKRDHDYLIRSLIDFTSALNHRTVPVSADIGVNLRSWLTYHIKKFDEAYVVFTEARPDVDVEKGNRSA